MTREHNADESRKEVDNLARGPGKRTSRFVSLHP